MEIQGDFVLDIDALTLANKNYRKVIKTEGNMQIVLMSVKPGEDIHLEAHNGIDQFIKVVKGRGEARFGKSQEKRYSIKEDWAVLVPSGTYHRIINTGTVPLKLYTIYSPPNHAKGKTQRIRPTDDDEAPKRRTLSKVQKLAVSHLLF